MNLCYSLFELSIWTSKSIFRLSSYCLPVQFDSRRKLPKLSQISHLNFMFNIGDQKPMFFAERIEKISVASTIAVLNALL